LIIFQSKRTYYFKHLIILFGVFFIYGCGNDSPIPKPIGYFRIDLPEPKYQHKTPDCPFEFDISQYSQLELYADTAHPCWFNIAYPMIDARMYITYKAIDGNLRGYLEEAHGLAYEHQIKANRISTRQIARDSSNVYGLIYNLGGNVASPYQFYLTDSTTHFLRGSLYFNARPNPDSTQPALDYVRRDIERFVDSFEWR